MRRHGPSYPLADDFASRLRRADRYFNISGERTRRNVLQAKVRKVNGGRKVRKDKGPNARTRRWPNFSHPG